MTDSSTEAAGVPADGGVPQDVKPAESSAADATTGVDSYRAAVDAALGESEAPPASEPDPLKGPDSKDPTGAPPQPNPGEIPEEELQKYSKGAQRRIRELVETTKSVKGEFEQVQRDLTELKPKAERMDELSGFMREHAIQPEHLNNALGLTAMINKGDYQSALPVLEALLNQVRSAAGEVLPPDLKSQVDLGYITEKHAKELHKAKLAEKRATDAVQKTQERETTERAQRELNVLVGTVTKAADAWSQEQATSDPDWNQKRDLVTDAMELELRKLGPEGYPRTEKAVRDLLVKVKQAVDGRTARFRPTPKAIDNVTGRSPSPRSSAAPASYLDAVNVGLAASRSG